MPTKPAASVKISPANRKLAGYVARLKTCTGERDMYAIMQNMLIDRDLGIRLTMNHFVIDTNIPGRAAAPDLALFNGRAGKVARTPDFLFGLIECKPRNTGVSRKSTVLNDKRAYIQAGTRWFFVCDQGAVARLDLDDEAAGWSEASWSELSDASTFRDMFGVVSSAEMELERQFTLFEEGRTRFAHRDVAVHGRRAFIATIRQVSKLLDEAVSKVIARSIVPSVREGRRLVDEMSVSWGRPVYRWTAFQGHPIEFERVSDVGSIVDLSAEEARKYAEEHAAFALAIAPHLGAVRLETETLATYAAKSGADAVSFIAGKKNKKSQRAVATFAYETASLILSRMLMVRFSEDHGFLTRQISNGGVRAFAGYASYFQAPYQVLLSQAYKTARTLYRDLFDPQGLDWVLDADDRDLSDAIRLAMLLLSRWNFKTVRGDILSGVYDHYLETDKRRDLGEVFTRPEIARYVLDACGWDRSKTLLDPACGTGTFLVEALRAEVDRLRAAGALDLETASGLLRNVRGLDINPFSVSLSQIQILWHMMDLFDGRSPEEVKRAAETLLPHIQVGGGISSLETMGAAMSSGAQTSLQLGTGRAHVAGRRMHDFPARFRQINGGSYDIVVGNPPYVRAQRRAKQALEADYREVAMKQFDLYVPFVYRTLRWWLKEGGRMGLVIPMAMLDAGYAEGLRAVLSEYRIVEIVDLELLRKKTFHGVKRPTVILIVENARPSDDDTVILTTVPASAHDPEDDFVDMTKAVKVTVGRKDILQTSWLPSSIIDDAMMRSLTTTVTGAGAELTTKIKPDDRDVLARIAAAPRLAEQMDLMWIGKAGVTLDPTDAERRTRRPSLLIQYGLKLGGDEAIGGNGPMKVYKALNIFPGRLLGEPLGAWNEGKEDDLKIYRYLSLMRSGHVYAAREISQLPTIVQVPDGAMIQNTAMLFQLRTPFPINIWVLSRVVQFYAAKLLRASIIEDLTAHWYKRQLCLLPVPSATTDLIAALEEVGSRLLEADRDVANEYARVDAIVLRGSRTLKEMIVADDPMSQGVDLASMPAASATADQPAITDTGIDVGNIGSIAVPDDGLRRWLMHRLHRRIDAGNLELCRDDLLDMPVPIDMRSAIDELDRMASADPEAAMEAALRDLDSIVGTALNLGDDHVAYIQTQMVEDDFLKTLSPAWEKRGLRVQSYRGDGADEEDGEDD